MGRTSQLQVSPHPSLALPNGREVSVFIRRSERARCILVQVGHLTGEVELVLPRGVPIAEGMRFAYDKAAWVQDRLRRVVTSVPLVEGTEFPLLGQTVRIRHTGDPLPAIHRSGGDILVSGRRDNISGRVRDWLKWQARQEIAPRVEAKTRIVGRAHRRITIRDTHSRWGSCSHEGNLSFCWRLIFAPAFVLDYVVAHEVAHLREMNHGRRFWALVQRLDVDPGAGRDWLRRHAADLHRYS
jgi:predicted metal-dependent hydrolase